MTTTFQPAAVFVPFLIPADEPLAPCPAFANGIYFNDTYLVFVLNITTDQTRFGAQYRTRLTTYTCPITANIDGTYGFGAATKAAVTHLSDELMDGVASYAVVNCVLLIDTVYVFIADASWDKVHVVQVGAYATPGTIGAGLLATLQLPISAPGFVPVAVGGSIQLLYPDPLQSQINSLVYDPTGTSDAVTVGPNIPVIGSVQAPYKNLSVADVPLGSGALNLAFTDSNNELVLGQVVQGAITNPRVQPGPSVGGPADLKVAGGPLIGQNDEASVVSFVSVIGSHQAVNYTQAPLEAPDNNGPDSVLGDSMLLHQLQCTFVSEAYVPLPGSDSALLRVLVYGAVLGGGLLQLYMIPTGQLFPQPKVVTNTSQTNGLSVEQKKVYEQSWNLLGIIHGPPPWVNNSPHALAATTADIQASPSGNGSLTVVTPTTATIEFSSTSGATSTVTYGTSVSIGGSATGEIFSFSGSASYALKKTVARSQTFAIDQPFQLGDQPGSTGLIIVSQPTISNTEYKAYSPDGSSNLHFSLYLVQVTDVITTAYDFDITNPSDHTYSAGLTALPASSDLSGWNQLMLPALPQVPLLPPALTGTRAASSTSSFSATSSQDVTSSNKVSVSATFGVFGFSSTVGFSWSNATDSSSSFSNSYSSTIGVVAVNDPPQSTDVTRVEIQPYILQTTGATAAQLAGLVPTLYVGSMPWILTWRVLSYSTYGGGTA